MSAANPKTPEPSIEDILASIRRIIADDQEVAKAPEPSSTRPSEAPLQFAAPSPPPSPPDDDVLDLADMAAPVVKPVSRTFPLEDEIPDISFRDIETSRWDSDALDPPHKEEEDEPEAPEPVVAPPSPPPPAAFREQPANAPPEDSAHLLSRSTDATVGQAFNFLAHTVLNNNARTLEDLVREMLRPMLKDWLDDNLPSVVERLVRAEIERVARGGR